MRLSALHSDDPSAFRPANPYAASDINDPVMGDQDKLTQLTVVATILLAMAMLTLAMSAISMVMNLFLGFGFDAPPNLEGPARTLYLIGQISVTVVQLVFQVVVILGAIAMIRRRVITLAWAGVTCSLIPICGPCIGLSIPAAIWGFVLLSRPGVKAAFS